MNSGSGHGRGGGVFVRLVEKKSGSGVGWVLEMSDAERAAADSRSLDCAGSFAIANDSASLGMTNRGEMIERWPHSCVVPWMEAVADPREKWWELRRNDPKQSGEISQAAFLLRARTLGFKVALPWGDSERYDFVVWMAGGPIYRVQVKGTGRLYRRGYEVQPVHTARGGRKERYTAKEIDVVAAHVQPVDAWYLLPIKKVGRAKSLRFYPDIESREPMWEEYREAWEVLGYRAGRRRGK
jgi:PD-(D/E)XK nuclease superfamily protein